METAEIADAARTADAIADRLASPERFRGRELTQGWWPQSLAHGAAGVALLHIERARTGLGSWQRAHDWLACAATQPAVGGPGSHLYYGAPALAFAVHAAADRPGRYAQALAILDRQVAATVRRRLERAHARMDRQETATPAEFDAIRGLTGLGALLRHRAAHADLLREVLTCLVRLTEPISRHGELLTGWWSHLGPSGAPSPDFPAGHANNGLAHGIAGPLALLSLCARDGVTVPGHTEAIRRVLAWFDRWQQTGTGGGPWWPPWITRDRQGTELPGPGPSRPSWCYGTAGFARAQQLAALAVDDLARRRLAEEALGQAVGDPRQLAATVDASLCHGFAGLVHLTRLTAADAIAPGPLTARLPSLLAPLTRPVSPGMPPGPPTGQGIGLLEGAAGTALALQALRSGALSASGWESCFLIN